MKDSFFERIRGHVLRKFKDFPPAILGIHFSRFGVADGERCDALTGRIFEIKKFIFSSRRDRHPPLFSKINALAYYLVMVYFVPGLYLSCIF